MSAAGAAGVGLTSLLGAAPALGAAPLATASAAATYAVGVRRYDWWRGSRRCTTYVYYPATGTPGGNPVTNAPVADGVFPVYNYTHGWGSSPQNSLFFIRPLAAAGFIVPAPHFEYSGAGEVRSGEPSRDVSEIITQTLALNASGPLSGHINTDIGVGVSGHSLGGMTTHGLLTAWPDSRIISANPQSCEDMGTPASSITAKVVFVHGDRDDLTRYDSARQAYNELTWPKGFLTFVGGSHTSFWGDVRFPNTVVDWALWSMNGDTAARDRLPQDAAGPNTRWEAELGEGPSEPTGVFRLAAQHSGKLADIDARSTAAGARLIQWRSTGATNQQFEFVAAGDDHYRIKARHSGLFLQVASNSSGADITQQPESGATTQQWRIVDHGGSISLINRSSGLAMDVWEYSSADGARISQWDYTGNANQRFARQSV
ncbi:RICIN domain-containing protein [Myceligenerans sp. TRM 65318]|uniref:RICIN domain-containing protein n=2 Tax=Myceligenerans pegani TaxID=2776917 RepID=A0ABR9N2W4_9MICO|nr:RICIN domain-containing protein [Myceligenerans sp. TRM 65318]MBE3019887.1 RICIN domain-containing protein [Myceligenerans sp. TRM 65318]